MEFSEFSAKVSNSLMHLASGKENGGGGRQVQGFCLCRHQVVSVHLSPNDLGLMGSRRSRRGGHCICYPKAQEQCHFWHTALPNQLRFCGLCNFSGKQHQGWTSGPLQIKPIGTTNFHCILYFSCIPYRAKKKSEILEYKMALVCSVLRNYMSVL